MPERTIRDLKRAITEAKRLKEAMKKQIRELDEIILSRTKAKAKADVDGPERRGPRA